MPGKHAPEAPTSFYLSVARAVGGALVVLGVVALIAIAAVGSNNNKKSPAAQSTRTSTPKSTPATSQTISPSATATATATSHPISAVTVNVLNGTTRAGLAKSVGDKLTSDGYQVKKVDNCNCGAQSKTTIYYRGGEKADAEALLRKHPELGRIAPATSDIPNAGAFLTVVLGTDYPVS